MVGSSWELPAADDHFGSSRRLLVRCDGLIQYIASDLHVRSAAAVTEATFGLGDRTCVLPVCRDGECCTSPRIAGEKIKHCSDTVNLQLS